MKVVPLKGHEMSPSILDLTINPIVDILKEKYDDEAITILTEKQEFVHEIADELIKYDCNSCSSFRPSFLILF